MKPLPGSTLNIQDMPRLFSKYRGWIITASVLGLLLGGVAANVLPKKYKTHFVLTIYSKYFQSPLIGDFVPGFSESGDMRSQREALIRQVLTPEYLDFLGDKYGIYGARENVTTVPSWQQAFKHQLRSWAEGLGILQPTNTDAHLTGEREDLLAHIEVYSLNATTFNIGFSNSDPQVSFQVVRDIYGQLIRSLLELRMHTLANVRDAVQIQVRSLPVPVAVTVAPVPAPATTGSPEVVEDDLASVRRQLRVLSLQYTNEHPVVIQLRDRERILVGQLDSMRAMGYKPRHEGTEGGSGEGTRDVYSDLMKKLNYLNIAIYSDRQHQADYFALLEAPLYPSVPLWPKKGLFMLWGLALGLFGSLFVTALREYFENSTLHTGAIAQELGLPLLGELPLFPETATVYASMTRSSQLKAVSRK